MAGQKGMKHFGDTIIEEVKEMVVNGKTQREISDYFGFNNKNVIKSLLKRQRKKEKLIRYGITPRSKGRPRKNAVPTEQEKDNEIKKLKMENELLRSFLQVAGRK
jgi:SOS-response transcriptional repressor LexA